MGIIVTWRGIKGLHSHVQLTATVDKVSLNSLLGPPILPPHTHRAHLGELTLPSPSTPPTHCAGQGHQASHPHVIRKKHLHAEHLLPHEVSWLCFDHYHHHPHLEETGLARRGSECHMWPCGHLSLEVWPRVPPTCTPPNTWPPRKSRVWGRVPRPAPWAGANLPALRSKAHMHLTAWSTGARGLGAGLWGPTHTTPSFSVFAKHRL